MASDAAYDETSTRSAYYATRVPNLPHIEHPMSRLGDRKNLRVSGLSSTRGNGRPATSVSAFATRNGPSLQKPGSRLPLLNDYLVDAVQEGVETLEKCAPEGRAVSQIIQKRPATQSHGKEKERSVDEVQCTHYMPK
jgi:hypothetical protein